MIPLTLILIVAVLLLAWHYRVGRDRARLKLAEMESLYGQTKREQRGRLEWADRVGMN